MTIFGDFVRESRQELGMTLEELSLKVGLSASMLSRLENGKRGIPSNTTFYKLAEALHVEWKELAVIAQESIEDETRRISTPQYTAEHFVEIVEDAVGVARVPVMKNITSSEILSSEHIIGTKFLPIEEIGHDYFYFEASDDSMTQAGIESGDHVLIQVEDVPASGSICLVRPLNYPEAILRKVGYSTTEKILVLQSGNLNVPTIIVPRFEWRKHLQMIGVAIRVEKAL